MGLSELLGAPAIAMHIAGIALVVGRMLHGLHFNGYIGFQFRPLGMVITMSTTAVLALGLIVHALTQMV